ncbi:MAG: hypothetical protein AAGD38_07350 [Acidobacteriota bacterium]
MTRATSSSGSSWSEVVLLSLAALVLALLYLTYLARMPDWDWNAARALPSVAMIKGFSLYYPADSGPVMSTLYGPVKAILFLPAALASTPTTVLAIAGGINQLTLLIPLWLLTVGTRPTRRGLLGFVLTVAAFSLLPPIRQAATSIHVDAPAIGLALLACWALVGSASRPRTEPPSTAHLATAAIATVLAAWTKQVEAPLAFALLLYGWKVWGREVAIRLFLWLAASAIVISLLFVVLFDASAMWFNIIVVPAEHPFLGGGGLGSVGYFAISVIELLILASPFLLAVLIAMQTRSGDGPSWPPWSLFLIAGIFLIPTSVLGRLIIGGNPNSYHALAFFLVAATWVVTHGDLLPTRPNLGRKLLIGGAAIATLATLPQLQGAPDDLSTWRDNPQEQAYLYAKAHPDRAYFPWNPLSTLLAQGELYHLDYNVHDRKLAGFPLSDEHLREHMPPAASYLIVHDDNPGLHVHKWLPEFSEKTTLDDLPGWKVFADPSRLESTD